MPHALDPFPLLVHNGPFQPAELIALFTTVGFNRLNEWNPENIADIFRHTDYYILAQDGGKLVGFARLLTDWHTRGYISNLCVAPAWRGRGIGKALMREMLSVCDGKGIRVLNVYDTSGKPDFYRGLGFVSDPMAMGLHRIFTSGKSKV